MSGSARSTASPSACWWTRAAPSGWPTDVRTLHKLAPLRTVVGVDKSGVVVYYQRGMPSTDDILRGVTGGAEG